MAEPKTKETELSVTGFISRIPDEKKRRDAEIMLQMFKDITGYEPRMWGDTMIGFGRYHYKYASGHEGDSFLAGFSPRKANFSIYLTCGADKHQNLLERLGKHKTGKACLYINKLSDVDINILRELIKASFEAGPKAC